MLALASVFCYDKKVFRAGCNSRPAVNLTSYFSFLVVVLSRYTLSIIFDCDAQVNLKYLGQISPQAQADVVRFHNRQYSLDGRRRKNSFVCSDEFIDKLQPLAQRSEGKLLGYKK